MSITTRVGWLSVNALTQVCLRIPTPIDRVASKSPVIATAMTLLRFGVWNLRGP